MPLRKGQKIWTVIIEDGILKAYTKDMTEIKLTRSERNVLSKYKEPDYFENINKEFSHNEPLHTDFSIMKNGVLVFEDGKPCKKK